LSPICVTGWAGPFGPAVGRAPGRSRLAVRGWRCPTGRGCAMSSRPAAPAIGTRVAGAGSVPGLHGGSDRVASGGGAETGGVAAEFGAQRLRSSGAGKSQPPTDPGTARLGWQSSAETGGSFLGCAPTLRCEGRAARYRRLVAVVIGFDGTAPARTRGKDVPGRGGPTP
jgi:hypothetical protein